MNKLARIRINKIDIKDYIYMRFKGLPTSVKWNVVKGLEMSDGHTFSTNCRRFKAPSQEVLIDEPSQETLRVICNEFGFNV